MDRTAHAIRTRLRTPRAAAVAGILFSLLFGGSTTLLRASIPYDPTDAGAWLADPARRAAVSVALHLVPFAGIAFLWFMGVVRDRVGEREDRLFATVFLGSGLLFIAMTFAAAAAAGGLLMVPSVEAGRPASPEVWGLARRMSFILMNVYALRVEAVFVVSTTTIGLRTEVIPRWLAIAGYAVALVLLFGVSLSAWLNLLFPLWILVLSLHILIATRGTTPQADDPPPGVADARRRAD